MSVGRRAGRARAALVLALVATSVARAQVVSTPTPTNASSTDETVTIDLAGFCVAGRRSQLSIVVPGGGATFATRYAATVFASNDGLGLSCPARTEVLDTDYALDFTVTSPRLYRLVVDTRRTGDANVRTEAGSGTLGGEADQGAVSCLWSGGTLVAGGCDLPDPGPAIVGGNANQAYDQTSTLTLCGTSDGAGAQHTLQFVWTQSAHSDAGIFGMPATEGDNAAIRLGDAVNLSFEEASEYPGTPARTQADDGHFTTVTVVDLCGNGVIDVCGSDAEACDEGAANGSPFSCCTTDCRLKSGGTTCRPSGGACDPAEVCTGSAGACPGDLRLPSGIVCRPSAGPCDVTDACNGVDAGCPDVKVPGGTVCRPQYDGCDQADLCDGASPACPDVLRPASFVCRGLQGQGGCDIAETCSGTSAACPADAIKPASAACRPALGDCDVTEVCDGVSTDCPIDQSLPGGTVCRASTAACDPEEVCPDGGVFCPVDVDLTDVDNDLACGPSDNCPLTPNPAQDDVDGDGLGDACDPCAATLGIDGSDLTVKRLYTPVGDDQLKLKGLLTGLPPVPTLDPLANGARVLMSDATGAVVLDAVLPAGAWDPVTRVGWTQKGPQFRYRHQGFIGPPPGGIFQMRMFVLSPTSARVLVAGRLGSYPIEETPVRVTIVVNGTALGALQCADETFTDEPVGNPEWCRPISNSNNGKLRCRP